MSAKAKIVIALGSAATAVAYLGYTGNESFYKQVLMRCVRRVDAEKAHVMAVKLASMGLVPKGKDIAADKSLLQTDVFGLRFPNPVGLAAGFDKDAECFSGMLQTGFGFVEVGSVTPQPQDGNAKPRVFRLSEDRAIINRYGFNSDGIEAVKKRLQVRVGDKKTGIVGVNVGRNKSTSDPVEDFVTGIRELGEFADYVVINVSSPNTPGLRKMQGKEQLQNLILKVLEARSLLKNDPPLLLKIAPDLTEDDKIDIADVVMNDKTKVDGLIISNTTVSRPKSLESQCKNEIGGLSGQPLKDMATKAVSDMYKLTKGRIPIIGAGGVSTGQDAYDKILAGASLVQLYSALAYEGPPVVSKIKRELANHLRQDGFKTIAEAVGSAHRKDQNFENRMQ